MARSPVISKDRIKRTLQAAQDAGLTVSGYEVDLRAGKVVVFIVGADGLPARDSDVVLEIAEFRARQHGKH